jgi:hypothetical protein
MSSFAEPLKSRAVKTIKAAISLLLLSSVSALSDNAASTSSTSSLRMIIAMTSGEKPAVDGVNGKVDVFGGLGQSNAISVMSIDGLSPYIQNPNAYWNGLGGAIGTITIPVGHQFGAQIDLGAGTFSNRANGSAAGHFFWRDPEQGLIVNKAALLLHDKLHHGPSELRQAYARLVMEEVAVTGEEIRISGSKSILARCATDGPEASTPAVLSFVREWRSLGESNPCFRRERATS